MAAGVPVVSSPSAVRAIEGEDGRHYAVADEVGEWASRLAELLEDGDLAARRAREADAFVRERFSWDVKAREFEAVLERAVLERAVRDHATPSGSAREATP
jgi:glycosyltransferase involved in cell wall biosynthesis